MQAVVLRGEVSPLDSMAPLLCGVVLKVGGQLQRRYAVPRQILIAIAVLRLFHALHPGKGAASRPFLIVGEVIQPALYPVDSFFGAQQAQAMVEALDRPQVGFRMEDAEIGVDIGEGAAPRSEEHTSELQSLMRNSYAVF